MGDLSRALYVVHRLKIIHQKEYRFSSKNTEIETGATSDQKILSPAEQTSKRRQLSTQGNVEELRVTRAVDWALPIKKPKKKLKPGKQNHLVH